MTSVPEVQTMIAKFQRQWEGASAAKDFETISSLFTENGIYLLASGGMAEGRQEIRSALDHDPSDAAMIRSIRPEILVGTMVFDLGTFTATLERAAVAPLSLVSQRIAL